MYQNYTFSFQGPKNYKRFLYCSQRISAKCNANLKLDVHGNIMDVSFTEHNHAPRKYIKTSEGLYIKVPSATLFI